MNLLTLDDIAALLKYTKPYVRDTLIRRPDFPRPAVAPSRQSRRWTEQQIAEWISGQTARGAR